MSGHNARNMNSAGSKKKGGGFLARQAKAKTDKKVITEEELLQKGFATADDVLRLNKITESMYGFLFKNYN